MVAPRLSKDRLARLLEEVPGFPHPNRALEQYPTPGEIAADILIKAFFKGDVENKVVMDLGAGTGRLGYAAALLGARHVIMVDIDQEAVEASREFLDRRGLTSIIDHLVADVARLKTPRRISTVLQNPPFGHVKKHADMVFLETALSLGHVVYSLHSHNPRSRGTICGVARKHGFSCTVISTYRFPIRAMYREHYKRLHYVIVDAYMFRRVKRSGGHCG